MTEATRQQPDGKPVDLSYDALPTVLLVADTHAGETEGRAAIEAAGARPRSGISPSDAAAGHADDLSFDAMIVEFTHDEGGHMLALLDRVDRMAARERIPAFVTVPLELVDAAAARLTSPQIDIMCRPTLADRVAALGLALGMQRLAFNDITTEVDHARLSRLADEVGRIAQALARLTPTTQPARMPQAVNDMMIGFRSEPILSPIDADAPLASEIRQMIRLRRMREQHFDADLFADPAWDMLLDLMAARLERKQVAVSSLCIAASVPPTTALRWIKAMTDSGIFERCADPEDGRRIFIRLSDNTANVMTTYLAATKKASGAII